VKSTRRTLEGAQKAYFLSLLDGRIDDSHVERRLIIGARHAELDIQPRWNVGAYTLYYSLVYPHMAANLEGETRIKTMVAWSRVLLFDMTLATRIHSRACQNLINASGSINATSPRSFPRAR
jgi:hypothetical protein